MADRSRGKVSHSAPAKPAADSTLAAIHSPKDRSASEDHTSGVGAKPHTELRVVGVVADRNHVAGHSHLADHKCNAARRRKADRRVVLRPRLRRDQEKLPWRTALL
jgi:hypothetical protein